MNIKKFKIYKKKLLSFILALGFAFIPIPKVRGDTIKSSIEVYDVSDNFYIGYLADSHHAHLINSARIIDKMHESGINGFDVPYNNYTNYSICIDDKTITYRPDSNLFFGRDGNIKCRFYATNSNFSEIDTIITVIGGTGSRNNGEDLENVSLSPNALIVVCYSGDSNINMLERTNTVADCTQFANYVFLNGRDVVCNSIVGTSEGAQVAFVTVANNPGVYQTLVCSNGSAYWDRGRINLIPSIGYSSFQNMEIIFLESRNNDYWNSSISQTIRDLKNHDVSMDNISFYTNDRYFYELRLILNTHFYFLSEVEARRYGNWNRHGDGMNMIIDSNILSYLSSAGHTARYGVENNYDETISIGNK